MPERRGRVQPALLLAGALALLARTAAAQQSFLPIGDLLCERGPRDAYLPNQRTGYTPEVQHLAGECLLGGLTDGDEPTCQDTGVRGHFAPDPLVAALRQLGGEAAGDGFRVLGGFLCVPRDEAPRAARWLDELRAATPPRLAVTAKLLRRSASGETVLLARTADCDAGRLSVLSAVRRRVAVVDYDVEIACPTSMANPRCAEVRDGVMIALRPHLAPSAEQGLLELVVRSAHPGADAKIDTGNAAMGPIDRVSLDTAELARVVPIQPGSRLVLSWSAGDVAFELELEIRWNRPQRTAAGGRDLGFFAAHGDLRGFRSLPPAASASGDAPPAAEDLEMPWLDLGALAGDDAAGLLACGDEPAPTARRFLATDATCRNLAAAETTWFETRRNPFEGELTCFAVPRTTPWPEDGHAPDGATRIGASRLQQADGTWSACTVREEHGVLRDWNGEIGCYARIADPIVARVSTGLVLNTHCQGRELEIDGELAKIVDAGRQKLQLSALLLRSGENLGDSRRPDWRKPPDTATALVADEGNVEHPAIARVPVHFVRTLAPGGVASWRTAADAVLGEGRDLVVVVTAK